MYLTHDAGNYTHRVLNAFRAPRGVKYVDSIDWRTKGAVTSVKYQVSSLTTYPAV